MRDDRLNEIQGEMIRLSNLKRELRTREKSLDARKQYLNGRMRGMRGMGDYSEQMPMNSVASLRETLNQNLPQYMVPGNVGGINEVCWPFYFQVEIDFGDDPSIASNTYERGFFQVDEEAAFILQSIGYSVGANAAGLSALRNAPLQVEFIDRQSSRRFNNAPMPLQMLGYNSIPSVLPTGMYIQPNAFLDVVMNGIPDVAQQFQGSGQIQFTFFGLRVRTADASKVLSTIFAR